AASVRNSTISVILAVIFGFSVGYRLFYMNSFRVCVIVCIRCRTTTHRFLVGALRVVCGGQLCLALVRDFAAAGVHAVLIVGARLNELVSGIVKRSSLRTKRAEYFFGQSPVIVFPRSFSQRPSR